MSNKVAIISESIKKEIQGKEFTKDSKFNPIQDADGNWVISEEEIEQCSDDFEYLKELELIEYKQPEIDF